VLENLGSWEAKDTVCIRDETKTVSKMNQPQCSDPSTSF
jgi:hypothetical protein